MSNQDYIVINCPHCEDLIFIFRKDFKCKIFRHAVYKDTNKSVNSHMSQNKCESLVKANKVYGCCKPFKLNKDNKPEICDYI